MSKQLNRLKVVLAEKMISNKWLAEQLGCSQASVSKWCTNRAQPDVETFYKIAKLLKMDMEELIRHEEVEF